MKKLFFLFLLLPSIAWADVDYYRATSLAECEAFVADRDTAMGYPHCNKWKGGKCVVETTTYADCSELSNPTGTFWAIPLKPVMNHKTGNKRDDPSRTMSGTEKMKIKTREELKRDDGFFPDPVRP